MTRTLADVAHCIVDCEHKTAPPGDGYALSVGTKAMKDGRLNLEACKPVSESTYAAWTRRMVPESGDLILAREAPIGQVVRVPDELLLCLGQRTVLIRPDDSAVEPRFLHYWLLGAEAQQMMSAQAAGATVPHLNVADIRDLDISRMPTDRGAQRFAASALGALDDLLDNNQQRNAHLRGIAEATYREWFSRFRFPGHEGAQFVDSPLGRIPHDWYVQRVSDVANLVRGRSYRKVELVEEGGVPFVNLKCMARGGGFRRDGLKRYAGQFSDDQRVSRGDLVLAVTDLTHEREILAQATLVPQLEEGFGAISLDVVRLVPRASEDRLALYFILRCSDFPDRVKEFANGATVLHLSPRHVSDALILWPAEQVRQAFRSIVEPIVALQEELDEASTRLQKLRTTLLQRLVTGQISSGSAETAA